MNTLLLDTNRASIPIYKELIKLGHKVIVMGLDPIAPLAKLSNDYRKINYTNIDTIKKIALTEKFDFILPGCTDLSYKASAKLQKINKINIDTLDLVESITDKKRFKELALKSNLSVPKQINNQKIAPNIDCIIKPTDSFSGNGVTLVEKKNDKEFRKGIQNARNISPSNSILIEDYISGQLYSHSAFIQDSKIFIDFFVREDSSQNNYRVDTSCVHDRFKEKLKEVIRDQIISFISNNNMNDGLIHTQFINKGDEIKIIEITRRCPGDFYSTLIKLASNFNYSKAYISSFIGNKIVIDSKNSNKLIIRHTIYSNNYKGFFNSINFLKPINCINIIPLISLGEKIDSEKNIPIAIIFIESNTSLEHWKTYSDLLEKKLYKISLDSYS